MWIYLKSEPQLYTVGFYAPNGEWHTDSDHGTKEEARERVHYLNGGNASLEDAPTAKANAYRIGSRWKMEADGIRSQDLGSVIQAITLQLKDPTESENQPPGERKEYQ